MSGSLLLDFDTIESAPKFFSILALVERAAGRRIVIVDADHKRKDGEKKAAFQHGIALHRYIQWNGQEHANRSIAKTEVAKSLRDKAPVIWIDLEFDSWQGEDVNKMSNIVTLNWALVMKQGTVPQEIGRA